MIYTVELRYIGGNLADLLHDMRLWFDRNRTKPEEFYHSSAPPGLAFRVGFGDRDQASAFAEAFQGCVEGDDPQGTGARWMTPPSPRETEEWCSDRGPQGDRTQRLVPSPAVRNQSHLEDFTRKASRKRRTSTQSSAKRRRW